MFGAGAGRTLLQRAVLRNIRKYHAEDKTPGAGLLWPVGASPKTTLAFILFFAPPFWAPFLIARHQMTKK